MTELEADTLIKDYADAVTARARAETIGAEAWRQRSQDRVIRAGQKLKAALMAREPEKPMTKERADELISQPLTFQDELALLVIGLRPKE